MIDFITLFIIFFLICFVYFFLNYKLNVIKENQDLLVGEIEAVTTEFNKLVGTHNKNIKEFLNIRNKINKLNESISKIELKIKSK